MRPDVFKTVVGTQFPFPIAYWFRRSLDKRDSREAACSLLLTTLEFLGLVLLADYLAQEDRDPELDQELSRLFESPLAAGVWRDWIFRILRFYKEKSRSPVLPELEGLLHRTAQTDLSRLLEWRNRWVHSNSPFNVGAFRKSIFNLLERIECIHKSSLFCTQESRLSGELHLLKVTPLKGDNDNFSEVEYRSSIPLETGQVYLYGHDSRELLSLHPLILYGSCGECDESHYFHFSRPHGRKLSYSSIPSGHPKSSEENCLALQQLFRLPKKRRISSRHFLIPGDFASLGRTLKPGDHLGPYRVEELIKIGGMAQIYRVTDTRAGKPRALKLLPMELCRDPILLMRFEQEAQNLKRLKHPHVVVLHDLGQDFGDHYLVLDLAIGGRIDGQVCRDLSDLSKPLSEAAIINVGKQVCDGLHYVHSQGVIHRDLKPGNLLVSGDRVLLTDFGISWARGEQSITLPGMPVGTPEYMAPEQIQEGEVENSTDIYALGCVLYELATGRPPFRADTPLTTALYHLRSSPPGLETLNPKISHGLVNIIYKCIQKKPEHRYQNARQLFDDLSKAGEDPAGPQVIQGEKVPQDLLEETRTRERRIYRRRLAVAVVGMLVLSLLLAPSGNSVFWNWRIRNWIAEARTLVSRPPVKWETVCDRLRSAYVANPQHPAVEEFLAEARSRGALTIHVPASGGSKIQIAPMPGEAEKLGLADFMPQVLSQGQSFRSGERILVAPGYYEVNVSFSDCQSVSFPIFVGREKRQRDRQGRWTKGRLKPGEPEILTDADNFNFGEEMLIEDLVSPGKVDPGFCYVPMGPFWLSIYEDGDFQDQSRKREGPGSLSGEIDDFETAVSRNLSSERASRGFLIAGTEATVEDFNRWFVKIGAECIGWLAEREGDFAAVRIHGRQRLEKFKEQYKGLLSDAGVEPDQISNLEELRAAFRKGIRARWERYAEFLRSEVLKADGRLPIGWVKLPLALAYARTQAPVIAGEFKQWLDSRIEESDAAIKLLEGLVPASSPGTDAMVRLEDFPEGLRFWQWGDRLQDLTEPQRAGETGSGWETARAAFERWLKEMPESSNGISGVLLRQWVQRKIGEEKVIRDALKEALQKVKGLPAGDELKDLPWPLRLEYGWDTGWGLPTRAQWERAFRALDTRLFPWGNAIRRLAWADTTSDPRSVDKIGLGNDEDQDVSPYGVRGLAGNLAEWVVAPGLGVGDNDFLKGGVFAMRFPASSRADYLIKVKLNSFSRWTGFRVVKEVLPSGRYRRQLR